MAAQEIRSLGVAISATGVIAGAFGHFSTQVGLWVRAPNHRHCARIPENLARRTPAWGRQSRVSCAPEQLGQLCWAIHGRRWAPCTRAQPAACPQPLPSPRPLGMGGGTRVGERGNRDTDSRSPERRRLGGPPPHRPTWGKREPPSPGVRSGKPRWPQSSPPLEQAAAATDRALGPANAFPSNPALPPPANRRRGRRAPLSPHVIGPAQPLVLPSDVFGLRVPAASPLRAGQALGSLGHSRVWLFDDS